MTLTFVFTTDAVDAGFVVECPEVEGAASQGGSRREALENLLDVLEEMEAL